LKDTDCAYIAGIIDGEGTITLTRFSSDARWRVPIVSVSSTIREILEFLRGCCGGAIASRRSREAHHKPSWSWKLERLRAVTLCERILPYLREPEKRYRAELLIEKYRKVTPRNGRYQEEQVKEKELFEEMFFAWDGGR